MRKLVLAVGVVCMSGGSLALATGAFPAGFIFALWGGLILLGTVWERVRYKQVQSLRPGIGWVSTEECFVDEDAGRIVRVWLEPATGERRYVAD